MSVCVTGSFAFSKDGTSALLVGSVVAYWERGGGKERERELYLHNIYLNVYFQEDELHRDYMLSQCRGLYAVSHALKHLGFCYVT